MSLNVIPVPLSKVIVPSINLGTRKSYVIVKGAKESTWQQFNAQNLNTNQISISANPPSRKHVINRRVFIRASWQLTFTGTQGAGGKLLQPGLDAPRQYPIARSLNTVQASIGNDNYSTTLNQYWNACLRYHHKNSESQFNSMTPAYLDTYQEYNDQLNVQFGGQVKNALGGYGEVADGDGGATSAGGRGGFVYTIVSDNGTTAVVNMTCTEPIFMSPFNFSENEDSGFCGVENMNYTFTFGDFAATLWSHDNISAGHSTITAISPALTGFSILENFMTLPDNMPPPAKMVYPYFEVTPYPTPAVNLAAGASTTITMNSVTLKSIPNRMYIFAQEDQNDMSFANGGISKTDTFAAIDNLNVTFNNKVGLLSTMTSQDLYVLSQANGCNMSWPAFTNYAGSVLAIDPSKDLSLAASEASGIIGNYQLGLKVTIRNPRVATSTTPPVAGRAVNYVLWVVVINEGIMSIINGSVSHSIGVFDEDDVLKAQIDPHLSLKRTSQVYGGDFLGIGSFLRRNADKIHKFVKDNRLISRAVSYLPSVGPIASRVAHAVGYGKPKKSAKKAAKKSKAGVLVDADYYGGSSGGKMVSRSSLHRRLGGGDLTEQKKIKKIKNNDHEQLESDDEQRNIQNNEHEYEQLESDDEQ